MKFIKRGGARRELSELRGVDQPARRCLQIAIEPRHFGLVRCARLGQRLKPARLLHHRGNFGGEMSRQRHRGDFRIISVANWANFAVEMGAEIGQRLCDGLDRKSTRLNSSHYCASSMPSSAWKKKSQPI